MKPFKVTATLVQELSKSCCKGCDGWGFIKLKRKMFIYAHGKAKPLFAKLICDVCNGTRIYGVPSIELIKWMVRHKWNHLK